MRLVPDTEQLAVRDATRSFCARHLGLDGLAASESKPAEPEYWLGLAHLGVLGMVVDAPDAGVGIVGACLAFEVLGAHLATGPVLWSTLAARFVDGVAEGEVRVTGVVMGDWADGPVVVEHGEECDGLMVVYSDRVELVARSELPPVSGSRALDPLTPVAVLPSIPSGRVLGGEDVAIWLRRSGEILSAAMLVGVAQGALDVARRYAVEREQFGVPIGSFQAIKHLLADMYVRVELARASAYAAAALAADPSACDVGRSAACAKLLAGDAGIANGRAAVQILGGMGFTWDMLPHYFLKRAWVLEHLFGTGPRHAAELARAVREEVAAP